MERRRAARRADARRHPPRAGRDASAGGDALTSARLPPGVRDHLPVEAARRRALVSALTSELERWGYRAIITPIYEYDDVLARGASDGKTMRAMRFVEPGSGEILALRPDLTPQVARLVATRLHDEPGPLRLAYEGSVVRMPDARELHQVGAELIDAPQATGDFEVIALAEAALQAAGVDGAALDLGHAGLTRAALDGLELDDAREAALHAALQKKDAAAVAELAAALPAKRRKLIEALPSLYGGPEVLSRARSLISDGKIADAKQAGAALDELEQLLERLAALGPRARLSIDLGEVRGFRYYTGTRFALFADGAPGALASGGRYDRLVERYGRAARATGFAVDVEALSALLKSRGAPALAVVPGVLVGGAPVAAAQLAARLRGAPHFARAVADLDDPPAGDERLRQRAAEAGLARVIVVEKDRARWFDTDGGGRGSAPLKKLATGSLDALLPTR